MDRYVVGITGASGSVLALRLITALLDANNYVHIIFTDNGRKVFEYECKNSLENILEKLNNKNNIIIEETDNMFSKLASGSNTIKALIVIPASMGTIAKMSCGISDNLLLRVFDVSIKEKRKVIVVPRETPLSSTHLKNMKVLSDEDVIIMPPMPTFYNFPVNFDDYINTFIGRVLTTLNIDNDLHTSWNGYN